MTWAAVLGLGTGVSFRLPTAPTVADVEPTDSWAAEPLCLPLEEIDEAAQPDTSLVRTLDEPFPGSAGEAPEFEGCQLSLAGTSPESWARELWQGLPPAVIVKNGHTERSGRWLEYEQIALRPGRPDSYLAYRYPVDAPVVSGYDLGEPDSEQRRGTMSAVGHGGLDLAAPFGTPITLPRLEHQIGNAEVLYAGWLYGETVVTRHTVLEGGVERDYLLLLGHLHSVNEHVQRGRTLREGSIVGFVGNSGSPQFVHLHLETRRVREGTNLRTLTGDGLRAREFSIVSDPRNLLPLRFGAPPIECQLRPAARRPRYWLGDSMALESIGSGRARSL